MKIRYQPDHIGLRRAFRRFIAAGCTVTTVLLLPVLASAQGATTPPTRVLTLEGAIAQAFQDSPKVDAARAGIAAAAGSERQAQAWPNPELSFAAENFSGTGPYKGTGQAEFTYGVSQLLELGGKREARRRAAQAAHKAAQIDLSATERDVIRDVTVAYMETVAADESLKFASDVEATAKRVLADVTRRVDSARDPLFQKHRAIVALTNARIARDRAEALQRAARQKLGRLLGNASAAHALTGDIFYVASAPAPLSDYEAKLEHAPDLKRYAFLRDQREADLALARAAVVPDIRANVGMRQFAGTSEKALVAGITLPIPVLNQNQGEIARAGAEVTRVLSERRQAQRDLAQQLWSTWTDWQSAWDEAKAIKETALPEAETAFQLALRGYRAGGFQYLDVLEAQRAFFETRTNMVAALSRLHAARADVERLAATDIAGTK
jgi:cobalt-zinc-cadmium efflux system outer membrane protein